MSRAVTRMPFSWHCGHVWTLIFPIYTNISDNEKQHYASPAANPRQSVSHNIFHRKKNQDYQYPDLLSLKMHQQNPVDAHQNPVVPPDSAVHPQNAICTYHAYSVSHQGRGFHAGGLVKYYGKYAITVLYCIKIHRGSIFKVLFTV